MTKFLLSLSLIFSINQSYAASEIIWNRAKRSCVDVNGKIAHYADLRECGSAIGQNLIGIKLEGRSLKGAQLNESNFARSNFSNSNLDGANFTDSNLEGANLRGAKFSVYTQLPFDRVAALAKGMLEISYEKVDSELGYLVNQSASLNLIQEKISEGAVPSWEYIHRHAFETRNYDLLNLLLKAGLDFNKLHPTQRLYLFQTLAKYSNDDQGTWFLKIFETINDKNENLSDADSKFSYFAIAVKGNAPISLLEKMISMGTMAGQISYTYADCLLPTSLTVNPLVLEFLVKELGIPLLPSRDECKENFNIPTPAHSWFFSSRFEVENVTFELLNKYEELGGIFPKPAWNEANYVNTYLTAMIRKTYPHFHSPDAIDSPGVKEKIEKVIQFFLDRGELLESEENKSYAPLILDPCKWPISRPRPGVKEECRKFAVQWFNFLLDKGVKFKDLKDKYYGADSIQTYICHWNGKGVEIDLGEFAQILLSRGFLFDDPRSRPYSEYPTHIQPVFFGCVNTLNHTAEKLGIVMKMVPNPHLKDSDGNNAWDACNSVRGPLADTCIFPLLSANVGLTERNNIGKTAFEYLNKDILEILEKKYGIKKP